MRNSPYSLSTRLSVSLAVWIFIALITTAFALSAAFRQNAEQGQQDLLLAHAYNLMGAIDVKNGELVGNPSLGDPRFSTPFSGWYWSVSSASSPTIPILHSTSIDGSSLNIPSVNDVPFSDQFRRTYEVKNESDETQTLLEAQLYVGESDQLFQVLVAADRSEIDAAIQTFDQRLFLFFLVFGVGTLFVSFIVVKFGLRPLVRAKRSLNEIRMGKRELLDDEYPSEIQPLATEINALMGSNQKIVDRARSQVGNLAHALKTPVAVIQNELLGKADTSSRIVFDQTQLMQSHVESYLNRARIAAQRGGISARSHAGSAIDKLLRVMAKLYPDISFEKRFEDDTILFLGEEQDFEEVVGNIVENASKFAKTNVIITLDRDPKDRNKLRLNIEDDGRGIPKGHMEQVVKRGRRLDESVPGSGLGLSIVAEIVDEYGGELKLTTSVELGGLSVEVRLPSSPQ